MMKFFALLSLLFIGSVTCLDVPDMVKIVQEHKVSDDASGGHVWVFEVEKQLVTLVYDTHANRMRLMSPTLMQKIDDQELLRNALEANFGSTLDVRYSINNDVMMAAYLHPLNELTEKQFRHAIDQVTQAAKNFGSSFSAGSWTYYGRGPATKKKEEVTIEEEEAELLQAEE